MQRRHANCVFGAALELRGYYDWIIHADVEDTVDKYLDFMPFAAAWRQRVGGGTVVEDTPLVGVRQQGSAIGFAYAKLHVGETLSMADGGPNFRECSASGQRRWEEVQPNIFAPLRGDGGASAGTPGHFGFS